jgi:septum formation protein
MFLNRCSLILASGSPRRKALLRQLGLVFDVIPPTLQEIPFAGETAANFAMRMAAQKAAQIAEKYPEACIIAADTVVALDGVVYGKPRNAEEAYLWLQSLNGKTHQVITGMTVSSRKRNLLSNTHTITQVTFAAFAKDILRAYIQTGEPMDKAGAYGIQGAGAFLVQSINGSYSNVVGLPISHLVTILLEHDVIQPNKNTG